MLVQYRTEYRDRFMQAARDGIGLAPVRVAESCDAVLTNVVVIATPPTFTTAPLTNPVPVTTTAVPPRAAAVIDKATLTRELVEASGVLSINVPCVAQAEFTRAVGGESGKDHPDKLQRCGVRFVPGPATGTPLVDGCTAQLECRVLPATAHVAGPHDLILAEVVGAWADERVFSQGRWHFEDAPAELRSLHHVAGGHFYATGEPVA